MPARRYGKATRLQTALSDLTGSNETNNISPLQSSPTQSEIEHADDFCDRCLERHQCWECHDGGRLRVERELDDPRFGETELCVCRTMFHLPGAHATTYELGKLRIPTRLRGSRIANFVPFAARPRIVATKYAETFPELRAKHLFLTGNTGTGKSMLAAGILVDVFERHDTPGEFWTVAECLQRFRDSFNAADGDGRETTAEVREHFKRVPLLVLDELGVGDHTEWAAAQLFEVVDYRYNELKPLIVTANVDVMSLPYRIASRLNEPAQCTRVTFGGKDQRPLTTPGLVIPFTHPSEEK